MFDARTDLPTTLGGRNVEDMSLSEFTEHVCTEYLTKRNDPAYERVKIDELATFIEEHLLDELADQGCVEAFVFLARDGLEREFKNIELFKGSWRTAAARQVWFKYNH